MIFRVGRVSIARVTIRSGSVEVVGHRVPIIEDGGAVIKKGCRRRCVWPGNEKIIKQPPLRVWRTRCGFPAGVRVADGERDGVGVGELGGGGGESLETACVSEVGLAGF